MHARTHTQTHTHTHTHTRARAHTHARTHARMHALYTGNHLKRTFLLVLSYFWSSNLRFAGIQITALFGFKPAARAPREEKIWLRHALDFQMLLRPCSWEIYYNRRVYCAVHVFVLAWEVHWPCDSELQMTFVQNHVRSHYVIWLGMMLIRCKR